MYKRTTPPTQISKVPAASTVQPLSCHQCRLISSHPTVSPKRKNPGVGQDCRATVRLSRDTFVLSCNNFHGLLSTTCSVWHLREKMNISTLADFTNGQNFYNQENALPTYRMLWKKTEKLCMGTWTERGSMDRVRASHSEMRFNNVLKYTGNHSR